METMKPEIPTNGISKSSIRVGTGVSLPTKDAVSGAQFSIAPFSNTTKPIDQDAYRYQLARATHLIGSELHSVETMLKRELVSRHSDVDAMLAYVSELGGKRLRPSLLLLSAKAVGEASEESIRLSVVVELVHTATLVHDDILDSAETRRHKATLHNKWSVPSSILTGDWLFSHAYGLANKGTSTIPGRWIADAAKQVCEGEILQGNSIKRFDITVADQVKLLESKTGALTAVSCALGAWSAGGNEIACHKLQQYGLKLGTAFQVYDDWLDVWGERETAGKTLGTDLESFKPTLPSLRTLQFMCPEDRERMIERLNAGDPTAAGKLRTLMDTCDAAGYTKAYARALASEAIESLKGLPRNEAVLSLESLAAAAVARSG
jgi:octaprenyl-diphosphate synthase